MKIALMGYARSGKDTIYELVQKHSSSPVYRLAFGDDLRFLFHRLLDIPKDPKPREGYEIFGKAMRDLDKNFWVKQLDRTYQALYDQGADDFIITDLRQPNEALWAKENGFKIVRVLAEPAIRKDRSQGDSDWFPINDSEKHIRYINCDYVIFNNGSIDNLEDDVIKMIKELSE